jgi:hypothetical protein
MARRNRVAEFFEGFNQGYGTVSKVLQDSELRKIASEQPTTSEGFTAEQGDQLRAAAESGQYDIAYDEGKKGYTVTPKAGGETGVIAQQGVTDFMGQRTAGTMTPSQVNNAKTMAMAGVLKKFDPVRGMQMEQQAIAGQRDEARFTQEQQRFGREQKNWERQDEEVAKQKEYEEGRKGLFSSSRFGQNQQSYNQAMADYQKRLADYEAARASGKTGPELGLAPVAPSRPEYSVGDALADRASLIDHDARFGKLDAKAFGEFTDLLNKVQSEGYEKTLRLAQSGGSLQEVAKAFNATGKVQFDPANVISDKMVKNKDGVETRVIQFKDAQGNTRTINTVAELDSLGKAGEVFNRFYQSETNRRGNEQLQLSKNADARAATSATNERDDKTAKAAAAVELFKQRNPNATTAELEAVRRGVIDVSPDSKNAPSEVKLAQAMVNAGLAPDMRSGLEMALTKKTQDPGELHKDFVAAGIKNMAKPEDAVASADKVMETMGYAKANGRWAMPAAPKAAGVSFASEADAEKAAKEGKIKKGDRITIGGKTGTWQ